MTEDNKHNQEGRHLAIQAGNRKKAPDTKPEEQENQTTQAVQNDAAQEGDRFLFRPYPGDQYIPGIKRLRIILMIFLCIDLFGFPTAIGGYVQTFCGFVPIAFFILSGYLVLWEDENRSQKIVRTIKRTAIVFGVLVIAYFIMNLVYYRLLGVNIFTAFTSKRLWFNFIVLNVWPFDIGTAIWYVQSHLYAYMIIFFLDKWKLLRFDWLIALVLIVFAVITGELAGVIRWSFLGYNYTVGNFLTRALPYILLGGFMQRKMELLGTIHPLVFICAIPVGVVLMVLEIVGLGVLGVPGYYGHLIGMAVVAVSVCMLTFMKVDYSGFEMDLGMSRWHVNSIYYLCQPVSIGVALALSALGSEALAMGSSFIGFITFLICFGIAWLMAFISRIIAWKKFNG